MIHYFEEKIKGTGFFNAVYKKYPLIEFSTNKNIVDSEIIKEFQEYFSNKNQHLIIFDCSNQDLTVDSLIMNLLLPVVNSNILLLNFDSKISDYDKEYYQESMRNTLTYLARIATLQNNHLFIINKNQKYVENMNNLLIENPNYLKEKEYCRIEIMDIDNQECIEIF